MKAKERLGPVTLPALPTIGAHAATSPVRAAVLAWEDWFRQTTSGRQAEALALAQRHGFACAQQLSVSGNGVKAPTPPAASEGVDRLRTLLAGKMEALHPFLPQALESLDPALAPLQQQAARRLSATPDVALLRSKPCADAVVLAEIIAHASRMGQRVLFLAHQPSSLDRVLQRLHMREAVLPVRFLGAGEAAAQLAPTVRGCTLDAQRQLFQTGTLVKAQTVRAEAEERCRRRHTEEPLWAPLIGLAQRHAELEEQRQTLARRIEEIDSEVRREAESVASSEKNPPPGLFALQVFELLQECRRATDVMDKSQGALEATKAKLEAALAQVRDEQLALGPLILAKQRRHWWRGAWWRATFTKQLDLRVRELDQRQSDLHAARVAADKDLEALADNRKKRAAQLDVDRHQLIDRECERRRQERTLALRALEQEMQPLFSEWQVLAGQLDQEHVPDAVLPDAVAAAQARWQEAKEHDETACLFARQWAAFVQESAPHFVAHLPRYASLLLGTIGALTTNAEFAGFADGPFDLVILDDADRLLENDLLRLAKKGRRWLFISRTASSGNGRPTSFDKLWHALHADPSRLAYRWRKEGAGWRCELGPVLAQDRRYLETERLADFPEIELRILAAPKTQPHLAQVVFPASMTFGQAKQFIYRELQEAAVQPEGRGAWLEERADAWVLHLGGAAPAELVAVELEPGIREWASACGVSHRLEFDRPAWSRSPVEDWTRRYLNLCDLGRTFELT